MNKILAIVRREFIERVRTRSFILGTFLVPLMMALFGYLPQLLIKRETGAKIIIVLDGTTGGVGRRVSDSLASARRGPTADAPARFVVSRLDAGGRIDALRDSLVRLVGLRAGPVGSPDGLLIVTDGALDSGTVTYLGSNVTSIRDMNALERILEPVLRRERLVRQQATPAVIAAANVRLKLDATKVTEGKLTGQSAEASFWLAYVVNFIMYLTLLLYGIQVMSAVIEEKSNRIVEILVSSVTPFQLLLGKVIGVAGVGLVQLAIWGGAGFYVSSTFGSRNPAGAMDQIAADGARQSFTMPDISPDLVVVILVFFLLGFLLYSALYAAVGAMCNTQQEAQQANTPVTMLIALGMITMFSTINDPSGSLARGLSLVPFFAPIVVPVRYAIAPLGLADILLSVASLAAGIVVVVWVAGRIYRVGILSYGKKPSPRELWRWVRAS